MRKMSVCISVVVNILIDGNYKIIYVLNVIGIESKILKMGFVIWFLRRNGISRALKVMSQHNSLEF